MGKMKELAALGQAIWLDYIRRSFITSGELAALVAEGLRGVTSNPSIFENAIAGSNDYDAKLHEYVDAGMSVEEIYEALVIEDIQAAADELRPVYEAAEGTDGFVSLEVSPALAHDTDGTVSEARRLFKKLARPNVMIKVPATDAGLPAITTLIGEGINVNVTLMFSLDQYDEVADAYLQGLERLAAQHGDLSRVASVASFFISRVDSQVDARLEAAGNKSLQGKIAIANARLVYDRFEDVFSGERWELLAGLGGHPQRVLWASTSTKNPAYPDTLYINELIGPKTVNTVPPGTLKAYLDHGVVAATLAGQVEAAEAAIESLTDLEIDLNEITTDLLEKGLKSFEKAFETLLNSIKEKREKLLAGWLHQEANLGPYQAQVDNALREMDQEKIIERIWSHDHTVWAADPTEITNRLGWLDIADRMTFQVGRLEALQEELYDQGFTHAVLLGMGGSSLAPEVFLKTFGVSEMGLDLSVLDSTDPEVILEYHRAHALEHTVFIVATKSGGTVETLSLFKYFYNQVAAKVGIEHAGDHFIAITDPGSKLEALANQHSFRATFLNDPNIGGRYSALSFFGLVPAALIGIDLPSLLGRAARMGRGCESCVQTADNPGAWLGAILGELALAGRDKVTFLTSPSLASFGDWVEQLIAESTGKDGKGILPVVGEPVGVPDVYADDRLFVHLRLKGDDILDEDLGVLEVAGHPVVRLHLHDPLDLGGQFLLWELATAVAGARMGIQPFDQPNVEAAKILAREMVAAYHREGTLPALEPNIEINGTQLYSDFSADTLGSALQTFLDSADPGEPPGGAGRSYVAIQAYLDVDKEIGNGLDLLRSRIRNRTGLATTVGIGPRFLHSTGQLHKGDAGNGLFVQITADNQEDIPIPDEPGRPESSMSFGVLKAAQAMGDRQALMEAGRRILRIHFTGPAGEGLRELLAAWNGK